MATSGPTNAGPAESAAEDRPRRSARRLRSPREAGHRWLEPHAIVVAGVLAAVWAWWTWKQGGYFGTVMLPGTILLCGVCGFLALTAPASLRLSPPTRFALGAIIGLGAWTLASALWSPAPDVAVADAQRVLTYAVAFGIGIWLCSLAGRRMELALAPLAVAAAIVAVATVVTLIGGSDIHSYLEIDGTLQFPLGYRNANAAFFFIAFWPTLGLATVRELDWRLRALALGAATLCLELGLLSQSRGSAIALPIAILIYLIATRRRAAALGWLILAALPALVVVGHLGTLYHAALAHKPLLDDLHSAGTAAAIGAGIAVVAGAVLARFGARLEPPRRVAVHGDRAVLYGLFAVLVAGIVAFTIAVGNPIDWVGQRVTQFNRGDTTSLKKQTTRFGFNTGTGRGDLWRVALLEARKDPVLGTGGGGYHFAYLKERHSTTVTVRDAHSVELETLSELGVPGLALLLTAIVATVIGIRRARRVGPAASALGAVAFAAGAYWLAHSSIDWFWPYPAVTAPVICLAGAACAPALRRTERRRRGLSRPLIVTGALILAVSAIPPFLSERYVNQAFAEWHHDLSGAYSDLNSAGQWNPLSESPQLATGAIAKAAGDRRRAIDSFRAAVRKRPEDWTPHYYLATLYERSAPRIARMEVDAGLMLDPKEPALRMLRRRLNAGGG